jgi:hypothetical protein
MSFRSSAVQSAGAAWLVVCLTFAGASSATDARELYRLGLELYDERQYEGALEKFEESFRTAPSPNSKLYIARCFRAVGRTREAVAAYEQAAQLAKERTPAEAKYAATYQHALRELAVLRPPPFPEPRYVAATWTAAGIGSLGLLSFGVFGALARSRYASLESHCNPLPCPASEAGNVESGRSYQLVANVSLAVGISGAVTAVTLFVLGRPRALPYGQLGITTNTLQFLGEF